MLQLGKATYDSFLPEKALCVHNSDPSLSEADVGRKSLEITFPILMGGNFPLRSPYSRLVPKAGWFKLQMLCLFVH